MAPQASRTKSLPNDDVPAAEKGGDRFVMKRVARAKERLERGRVFTGARTARVSARVDPGLLQQARYRTGLQSDSELIAAALTLLAGQDTFGSWLLSQRGTLSDDFELAI